jgi:hypothetical protein
MKSADGNAHTEWMLKTRNSRSPDRRNRQRSAAPPGCVSDVDVRSTHDAANTHRPRPMIAKRDGAVVFGEKAAAGFWKNVSIVSAWVCCRGGTNYSAGQRFFTLPFERGRSKRIPYPRITPRRVAMVTASVRLVAFSFARILLTCVFTVPSLTKSVTPISLLLSPRAIR